MSKKPYMYRGLEWLEIARRKDWNDETVNPGDRAQYSEFQKPYLNDKGDHSYPEWEWSWPPMSWPPIGDITVPDPIDNPCTVDSSCTWAKILGPTTIKCGDCYPYTQIHVWLSCGPAPWFAAFGEWTLTGSDGECWLDAGLVFANVCCSEYALPQELELCYEVIGCKDCIPISVVGCDTCCERPVITGSQTVAAGMSWTGSVVPPCPNAEVACTGSSCGDISVSINFDGDTITAITDGEACGNFGTTLSFSAEGCEGWEVEGPVVRITGSSCWCGNPAWDCTAECPYAGGIRDAWCFVGNDDYAHCNQTRYRCGAEHEVGCGPNCPQCIAHGCTNPWGTCDQPLNHNCTCVNLLASFWYVCRTECGDGDSCPEAEPETDCCVVINPCGGGTCTLIQ